MHNWTVNENQIGKVYLIQSKYAHQKLLSAKIYININIANAIFLNRNILIYPVIFCYCFKTVLYQTTPAPIFDKERKPIF